MKQTEELLKNGHTTRGKYTGGLSFAKGNAYALHGIPSYHPNTEDSTSFANGSKINNKWDDAVSALSDAASDLSDAADEFNETFDWIEVRLEELDETLSLLNARLENAVGYTSQNSIIDEIIGVNNTKADNLNAAIKEYSEYAAKLLNEVPAQYREAAQNGAIAIDKFTGEADEKTLEAINNYREWAQKVADTTQQVEELKTENTDLAKQQFDNVSQEFENLIETVDRYKEQYESMVSYVEETGNIAPSEYYDSMMEKTQKNLKSYQAEKAALQSVLDAEVKAGRIKVNSDPWYEMVNAIIDVDSSIKDCTLDLEKYQNEINNIHWDNFDELINRIGYLKDETQSLIDLMGNEDMVITPETDDGWAADQVEWTKEGIASMGMYAQQMETAEYETKQYAEAIDDLTADYNKGLYSESEYLEKLNELTEGQYDSIEAYHDAKKAIVDLHKARVDEIKNGIEKEVKAREELIKKKKEELSVEKDLYDFQKQVAESSKNIADIQRKLTALSADNSASAIAKRKKLEAELAEAKKEQEELYYERSIENQQNSLDKELENFQEEKEAEKEKWEKYLEDIEQIVADSLNIVQANATEIGNTLTEKTGEYNLTVSDAVLSPWKDGALAIDDYQTAFGESMSSTMDQLDALKNKWQEVIDKMAEAANINISAQDASNAKVTAAKEEKPKTSSSAASNNASSSNASQTKAAPSVGGTVTVKKSATHFGSKSGSVKMASFVPGGSYTVYQVSGSGNNAQVLIGKNGVYTGWAKLTDIEGFASGTTSLKKSGLINVDELGDELILGAHNGRLTYLEKGSGVIPADVTSNLMSWGELDPQEMLDRNRPQIVPSKSVVNTEISINMNIAEVVHVDKVTNDTLPDLTKVVEKQMDSYMVKLNNSLKRFTR